MALALVAASSPRRASIAVIVVRNTGGLGDAITSHPRDNDYTAARAAAAADCPCEEMSAEDPLFILSHLGSPVQSHQFHRERRAGMRGEMQALARAHSPARDRL